MIYNKHNFDDASERIEDLENKLNDLVQCLAQGYYPTKLVSAVRVTRALEMKTIKSLKVSVEELIDVYNNVPSILANSAVTVSVEAKINNQAEVFLNKSKQGNYWIIATKLESKPKQYWLLPNGEIDYHSLYRKLFNKYSITTIKTLFNLQDQEVSADKNLIIEQPAQVTFIPSGRKWKLRQPGRIVFGVNSRSYQLQALKQINQQHQELKSQIIQLKAEIAQLKSSLKQSEIEPKLLEEYQELSIKISPQNIINRAENVEEKNYSPPQETQPLEFVENPETKEIPTSDKWQEVQLIHELTGHTSSIRTLAIANWNNDKQIIISGSFDETIKIWNLNRGELINSLDSVSKVNAIMVTPDGNSFISGGDDGNIQICDISTATRRNIDAHSHRILAIAVSPDGKTIFSGSRDHSIKPWNYDTGEICWNRSEEQTQDSIIGDYGTVIALDISSNGDFLASSTGDNIVRLWDLKTYKLSPTNFQHSDLVWSVAISPDGKTLICGCRDKTIRLWDVTTGELKHSLTNHSAEVWTVGISPDGRTLASGSGDHTIKLWNLDTGELLHSLESHSNAVYALAFSSDGKYLVSAGKDQTIKIWQSSS